MKELEEPPEWEGISSSPFPPSSPSEDRGLKYNMQVLLPSQNMKMNL